MFTTREFLFLCAFVVFVKSKEFVRNLKCEHLTLYYSISRNLSLSSEASFLFLSLLFLAFALFFSFPRTTFDADFYTLAIWVQLARDGVEKLVVCGQS